MQDPAQALGALDPLKRLDVREDHDPTVDGRVPAAQLRQVSSNAIASGERESA